MGDEAEYLDSRYDGFEGCVHTCRRCGVSGLRWSDEPPWRLEDESGNIHVCKKKRQLREKESNRVTQPAAVRRLSDMQQVQESYEHSLHRRPR